MWSSISPDDWDWLKALISDPGGPRDDLVRRCRAEKPHLAEALLRMLAASGADSTAALASGSRSPMFQCGELISARYEVEAAIGWGGMGEVYRVRDSHWPRRGSLALKTIRTGLAENSEALSRFEHEVRNALEVAHPNVCRIYDVGRHDNSGRTLPWLTMEYLDGVTLAARLQSGPMSEAEALPVIRQIAEGLAAIHARGIVHRDLKPGNIILVSESGGCRAVITDFGLARAVEDATNTVITRAGAAVGTPAYMAPEQLSGDLGISCAADVYSLGVTAHEMLTGRRPAAGAPDGLDRAPISPGLRSAIRRCLETDRYTRLQKGGDIVAALNATPRATTEPATEAAGGPEPRRERPARITTIPAVLAFVLLLILAVLVRFAWTRVTERRLPAAAVPLMNQATVKYFDNSFYDASRLLEKITAMAPDYPLAHAMLADSWNELESTLKAQQQILRMTNSSHASSDDRLFIEGVRDTVTHDYGAAVKAYRSWYEAADPASRPGRAVVLGRALQRDQKPDEAAKVYAAAGRYGAALLSLGDLHAREEKQNLATTEFEQARSEFRERGEYGSVAAVDFAQGSALTRWNRSPEAKAMLGRCVEDARTTGNDYERARCHLQLATLSVREAKTHGDLERSKNEIATAIDTTEMYGFRILGARAWLALAQVNGLLENYPDAEREFTQALTRGRDEGSAKLVAQVEVARSDLLQRMHKDADAEADARAAFLFFKSEHSTKEAAQAAVVLARALRNQEKDDEAVRILGDPALANTGPIERRQIDEAAASILYLQRNYPAALERYQAIVAELPANIDAAPYLVSVAMSKAALGYLDAASGMLDQLAPNRLTPLNASMVQTARGWIDLYRTRYDRAFSEFSSDAYDPHSAERGLALAGMRRFNESFAVCDHTAATGRRDRALLDFCAARALDGLGKTLEAARILETVESAGVNTPELAWRIAGLGIALDRALGESTAAHEGRARDALDLLRSQWGETNYERYLARPDIASELKRAGLGGR